MKIIFLIILPLLSKLNAQHIIFCGGDIFRYDLKVSKTDREENWQNMVDAALIEFSFITNCDVKHSEVFEIKKYKNYEDWWLIGVRESSKLVNIQRSLSECYTK